MGLSFKTIGGIGGGLLAGIPGAVGGYLLGNKTDKTQDQLASTQQEYQNYLTDSSRYADMLKPNYTAAQRYAGGDEQALTGKSSDILKMRERALGGYSSNELSGLRNQLTGQAKAQTAQNIRETMAGQGRMGLSGATAGAQVQTVRQAGQRAEQEGQERLMTMQRQAQGEALDRYETDVLGRQLAIQAEETGRQQTALALRGQDMGIAYNQPVATSSGLTMLCAVTIGNGLLPDDLMASDVLAMDRAMPLIVGPIVMSGYVFLMRWAASLAKKNKFFARFVSFFVIAWMRSAIKKEKNLLGFIINKYGQKICAFAGGFVNGKKK